MGDQYSQVVAPHVSFHCCPRRWNALVTVDGCQNRFGRVKTCALGALVPDEVALEILGEGPAKHFPVLLDEQWVGRIHAG